MTTTTPITCLFVDIGGVLLTNGWDHHARRRAVAKFDLDWDEMEERHQMNVAIYEEGKLTLEDYLNRTVFYVDRPFTQDQFFEFMVAQTHPDREMLALVAGLKTQHGLRIVAVSNEARELNGYRIREFGLDRLVDCFISSCFVHTRKPDLNMFRLALDIAQTPPAQIVYIDNTALFIPLAEGLGISGIIHTDYQSTRAKLAMFGVGTN